MAAAGGRSPYGAALVVAATLLGMGCGADAVPVAPGPFVTPPALPQITNGAVAGNPTNALSAIVTAQVRFAERVTVHYGLAGTAPDSQTPAQAPVGDSISLPVLGLMPDTLYVLRVVAYGGGVIAIGDTMVFRTGPLPSDIPQYVTSGSDPSPGYVVFSAGTYGVVIDNTGRVVWYRRFEYGAGLAFEAQSTGRYVARPGTLDPTDPHPWVEVDPLGAMTRVLGCARGLEPRLHDLIVLPDGSYWIMCDDVRRMDLSPLGGVADAQVTATAIQHVDGNGALLFSWTPFDHFDVSDLPPDARAGTNVNWTHGNALDLDTDGNVVVSFRNLNEITKIDVGTGEVLWRLGGVRNQFAFDVPGPAFVRQHGLRLVEADELLLLDNLGDSLDSRVERYGYDPERRTASLRASHGSAPPVIAQLGGSVQALPNGRTLVSFGTGGRVEEYDAAGNVVWRIEGSPGYVFRAQRIRSLYQPGVGLRR